MVGEFGEVQVMDWGLAKELASRPRQLTGESEPDDWRRRLDDDHDPASRPRHSESRPRESESRPRQLTGDGSEPDDSRRRLAADENVHHTAAGTIMGTPGYMAPEQARGEVVDARADVFALGSILAAILTGQPAFVGTTINETIAKAANAELADVLSRLDACGTDAELLAIARRCLAALPQDRFADGREVASAVASYRATVEARLRQAETAAAEALVREAEQRKRRRLAVTLGGSIAVVLLVGLAVSLWQMQRAVRAEAIAVENERQALANAELAQSNEAKALANAQQERLAKRQAEKNLQQANENLAFARKSNQILGSVFTGLDPKADYATVAELRNALRDNLQKAVKELEGSAIGEPLVVAEMQNTLGLSLVGLGEAKQAIRVFEKALGTRQAQLGADHPDTLASMNNLAECYRAAGQLDQALPLYKETLQLTRAKLGPDHPDTLGSMNNLALGYKAAGKLNQALPLWEETFQLSKAKLGPDHPHTLRSMNNLALGYRDAGQLNRALPLYEETLQQLMKAKLGPRHPHTLISMGNLGKAYCEAKQGEKAGPLLQAFVAGQSQRLPKDDPRFAGLLAQVAFDLLQCDQFATAEEMLRECLTVREKKEPGAWTTFNTMSMLGGSLLGQKKYAEAEPLLLEGYEGMKARYEKTPAAQATSSLRLALQQRLAEALDRLIELYTKWDKPDEVKKWQAVKNKLPKSRPLPKEPPKK